MSEYAMSHEPQREKIRLEKQSLNAEQFLELIEGLSEDEATRLGSVESGGVFSLFDQSELWNRTPESRARLHYILLKKKERIAAISKLVRRRDVENSYSVAFVNVANDMKSQGIGREAVESVFQEAAMHGWSLYSSGYTTEGALRLKHMVVELAEKYGVALQDDQELY